MKTNISSLRVFIESQGLIQGPLRAGGASPKMYHKNKNKKNKTTTTATTTKQKLTKH